MPARSVLPPYEVLARMRQTMSVATIAAHCDAKPNSVQRRLKRGLAKRDASDAVLRRDTILQCWSEGATAKAIARAVNVSPLLVTGVIARARRAGDPRAVRRYRERTAS